MKNIQDLLKLVPPPKKPIDVVTKKDLEKVIELTELPSDVIDLCKHYGSDVFVLFETGREIIDYIKICNILKKPLLEENLFIGKTFSANLGGKYETKNGDLLNFFPDRKNGLFPIMFDTNAHYFWIDQKGKRRIFVSD